MALPANVHAQLERMEARLRLVPTGETPPPKAVREQVQRWQEHVHEAAETIRWADGMIERFAAVPEAAAADRDRMLTLVRDVNAQAFDLMRKLNPDQAWFWTEEWQAGEREVDRDIAAGNLVSFASDEGFDAALDALDAEAERDSAGA